MRSNSATVSIRTVTPCWWCKMSAMNGRFSIDGVDGRARAAVLTLERGEGVDETGRQSPQAAVAQAGILLAGLDRLVVLELRQMAITQPDRLQFRSVFDGGRDR